MHHGPQEMDMLPLLLIPLEEEEEGRPSMGVVEVRIVIPLSSNWRRSNRPHTIRGLLQSPQPRKKGAISKTISPRLLLMPQNRRTQPSLSSNSISSLTRRILQARELRCPSKVQEWLPGDFSLQMSLSPPLPAKTLDFRQVQFLATETPQFPLCHLLATEETIPKEM